jgi:hypothetical protein
VGPARARDLLLTGRTIDAATALDWGVVSRSVPHDTLIDIVTLIKPQFEAGRKQVGKGGIVRDTAVHEAVLRDILGWAADNELRPKGLIRSPIEGAGGNVEFLAWLGWDGIMEGTPVQEGRTAVDIDRLVEAVKE